MAAASTSTVAYIYKHNYVGDKVQNLAARDRAFFAMVSKVGGFTGLDLSQAVQYGNAQGVSDTLDAANTAQSNHKGVQFTYTVATKYGIVLIDSVSMLKAGNDAGAFARLVVEETDSVIDEVGHRIAQDLYGDSSGAIGRVRSGFTTPASGVVTLYTPDDVKNFSVGMTIQIGTISGTTVTLRTGSTTVTAIDESNGTITLASLGALTSEADDDYLFAYGTAKTSGNTNKIYGLAAWLPLTAPSGGDSHFGVDRSVDTDRLAGVRVSSSITDLEEKLQTMAAKIQKNGGRPKHCFMNPLTWVDLSKKLGSKVEREEAGGATVGFSFIQIATPAGMVKCYADPECPRNRCYMLDMTTWKLRYLGDGAPAIIKDDGLRSLRGAASAASNAGDSIETRVRFVGQLTCSAPGKNGVCDV